MTTKLYCYVDETGQDTNGLIFVVGVVVVPNSAHADLLQTVTDIEAETKKRRKWGKTRQAVFLDGEQKRPAEVIGAMLKALGVSVEKVRTIRREDTNAFARLADAVCGLTRDAETNDEARELFSQACRKAILIDTRKE